MPRILSQVLVMIEDHKLHCAAQLRRVNINIALISWWMEDTCITVLQCTYMIHIICNTDSGTWIPTWYFMSSCFLEVCSGFCSDSDSDDFISSISASELLEELEQADGAELILNFEFWENHKTTQSSVEINATIPILSPTDIFKLPRFISRFSSWNFLLGHKFKFTTATFWHRKQESWAWAPGSTDCDSVECPRSCAEIAGNINYLYCQIPEMMPVVKPTQDTTPAPPHHSWAQPVNKDRNSSLPEIAREGSQLMPWPWLRFHKIFASEIFSPVPVGFLCYVSLCDIVNMIVLPRCRYNGYSSRWNFKCQGRNLQCGGNYLCKTICPNIKIKHPSWPEQGHRFSLRGTDEADTWHVS